MAEEKLRPSVAVGLRLQLERYLLHSFPIRHTWALEAGPEPKMRRRRASRVVRQSALGTSGEPPKVSTVRHSVGRSSSFRSEPDGFDGVGCISACRRRVNQSSSSAPQPIASRYRCLAPTVGITRWTGDAHVKMIVAPPPRPHFREPRSVSAGLIAKNLLDRRMNKDTLDLRIGCRELDQPSVKRCPATKINVEWISQHGHGYHVLSFLTREQTIWQPNVCIQANLMAGVLAESLS